MSLRNRLRASFGIICARPRTIQVGPVDEIKTQRCKIVLTKGLGNQARASRLCNPCRAASPPRLHFHVYNTRDEVDSMLDLLKALTRILG
jgi:selenocysteine lyase/cysteine desulfurase